MYQLPSTLGFIADTCFLIVVAYLLARGPMLSLFFREELKYRQSVLLGIGLGLVGLLEALFPDERFSYPTHTLFVSFAAIAGGLPVGLITASIVSLGAFLSQTPQHGIGTILAVLVSAFLGRYVRNYAEVLPRLAGGFAVGALAQACRFVIHSVLSSPSSGKPSIPNTWISIPINGFGVMLLLLVVTDAQEREKAERRRLEAERAHSLASEAKLAELRARVQPHFLFNTLNSIAELCRTAPERAERATLNLSALMRRSLETGNTTTVLLGDELDAVKTYLEIEQERLGSRLQTDWRVDADTLGVTVPPLTVLTLVENSVTHGVTPKVGQSCVSIVVRRSARRVLVAVCDNGVGMDTSARRNNVHEHGTTHGLDIVQQHLVLLNGQEGRLRLFSKLGVGTIAAFQFPV